MSNHSKRSGAFIAEIESLISTNLMGQWAGDKEGVGIHRIIELLRNNTTDHPAILKPKDNEPLFVLRGQDTMAPQYVAEWAHDFQANQPTNGETHPKYLDAMECVDEMQRWTPRKLPD